jgi:hypothetical protein
MLLLAFFCKDVELSVGVVVAGRPDLVQSSLGGGGRWWRAQILELEKLGRGLGRWVIANGFILFPMTGVYFDSFQSQRAMGLFQLMVVFGFFDGSGRRWGGQSRMVREGSRGINVIFPCLGLFVKIGWDCCLYILYVCVCICMPMYVFLN